MRPLPTDLEDLYRASAGVRAAGLTPLSSEAIYRPYVAFVRGVPQAGLIDGLTDDELAATRTAVRVEFDRDSQMARATAFIREPTTCGDATWWEVTVPEPHAMVPGEFVDLVRPVAEPQTD